MPDAVEKMEHHERVRRELEDKHHKEDDENRDYQRDAKRRAWDEKLQKQKDALDKARKKEEETSTKTKLKMQAKTQVIQLVSRINVALHRGGIKKINGVLV